MASASAHWLAGGMPTASGASSSLRTLQKQTPGIPARSSIRQQRRTSPALLPSTQILRPQTSFSSSSSSSFSSSSSGRGKLISASTNRLIDPSPASGQAEDDRIAELVNSLKWDKSTGLVVAIAQNADTGAVMMQGFADRAAVAHTLETRTATFFSRSRKTLWTKGESSGNFIQVLDVFVDCDRDTLIYWGLPDGPTCHTGETTCFFDKLEIEPQPTSSTQGVLPLASLFAVEGTILERQKEVELAATEHSEEDRKPKKPSWTQKLLSDPKLLCSKIREEADELCRTLEDDEGKERAASEMADLLYHSLVLLRVQGVMLEDVAEVLRSRFGKSGIEEKASRKKTVS